MMADENTHIYDIIIIGAGPCGLAVAARLREQTPSALFTDSEHQRYLWMKASSTCRNPKSIRTSRRSKTVTDRLLQGPSLPTNAGIDIAVIDVHGDKWMSSWDARFEDLKISHLRSPMFFHPDPRDRDGLLSFVHSLGREEDLREIGGVVGKELSKHQRKVKMKQGGKGKQEISYLDERDRNDYFRPSQALFKQYCEDVARRYHLTDIVQKSEATSISYDPSPTSSSSRGVFTLETSTGAKKARIVVFAVGAALEPTLPPDCPFSALEKMESVTHAFERPTTSPSSRSATKPRSYLPAHVLRKVAAGKKTNIVVVGGGLTSAQVAATAISSGVSKVFHIMRGRMKVKHFDVDLPWVGKYKNYHLATFWSADDDEERFQMVRDARGGGSITPEYKRILTGLESQGRVVVCTETKITDAVWDEGTKSWEIETCPKVEGMGRIDHVVYATGLAVDFKGIPALQPLLQQNEVKCVGGMPCLTEDLMWSEAVPFFVTGRLASLRLGPGAGNLEGARIGAERVAWKVAELLGIGGEVNGKGGEEGQEERGREEGEEVDRRRLGLGMENQFGVLGDDGGGGNEDR